uniref:Uncharacterized protein n=1 Tax=Romanomermis culicivorax TaxID=13658 RepID=A0A915J5W4_ROMCU
MEEYTIRNGTIAMNPRLLKIISPWSTREMQKVMFTKAENSEGPRNDFATLACAPEFLGAMTANWPKKPWFEIRNQHVLLEIDWSLINCFQCSQRLLKNIFLLKISARLTNRAPDNIFRLSSFDGDFISPFNRNLLFMGLDGGVRWLSSSLKLRRRFTGVFVGETI